MLFVSAVIRFHVDHVQPCIPVANGFFCQATVTAVIYAKQEEWDQLSEQFAPIRGQCCALFCGFEAAFVMSAKLELRKQKMRHLQRWEFVFVQHLVVAKQFVIFHARPAKMLSGPVHKYSFERLGLREFYAIMFNAILQRHLCSSEQWA